MPDLLDAMTASPLVNVRPIEGHDDIVACNFTRKAFFDATWDEMSVKARGLFLDTPTGVVVARGYEKFFNLGEPHGYADLRGFVEHAFATSHSLTEPVIHAARKYNGYLGIISAVTQPNGEHELLVLSKSGVTPYSKMAEQILDKQLAAHGCTRDMLAEFLANGHRSLTVEVIAEGDPHMVDEGEPHLVALDLIKNAAEFDVVMTDGERELLGTLGFALPQTWVISTEDVEAAIAQLESLMGQSEAEHTEGLVLRFRDPITNAWHFTKYKSHFYSNAKRMRQILSQLQHHGEFMPRTELDEALYTLIKSHVTFDVVDDGTIHGSLRVADHQATGPGGQSNIDMVSLLRDDPALADAVAALRCSRERINMQQR